MTAALLAFLNVVVWFATLSAAVSDPSAWRETTSTFGLVPARPAPWAFVTSMFLHASLMHLAANMYLLVVFGRIVESGWGAARFAILYLGGGLLAGVAHWLTNLDSQVPLVGASGAIAALMGAVIVAFPASRINPLALIAPFLALTVSQAEISAGTALLLWFAFQTLMFVLDSGSETGTAWVAHLAGFGVGVLMAARLKSPARREVDEDEF